MSSLDGRQSGSIKWYNRTKGYGFIRADTWLGSGELFFHRSAIVPGRGPRDLSPGRDVEYSVERDEVGRLRAVQVTRSEGPCFGCGKLGHHVKDCKDTPPGPSVICSRCGKWGHMARGCGKECYDCGEIGHLAVDCPRKQGPSARRVSTIGRDEISKEQERYCFRADRFPVDDASGDDEYDDGDDDDEDDDDCVILENSPFPDREKQRHIHMMTQRKLIMDFVKEFSGLYSGKICKHEKDSDKETSDDCALVDNNHKEEESDDDCIILDKNPSEEHVHETIINISKKLSLTFDTGTMFTVHQSPQSKLQSLQEGPDQDELVVVAEKGQVACRDYPHSRHLCVKYPFKNTLHQSYCNQCYCYVCDTRAPCKYWEGEIDGHCHASEQESKWTEMRVINRGKCP